MPVQPPPGSTGRLLATTNDGRETNPANRRSREPDRILPYGDPMSALRTNRYSALHIAALLLPLLTCVCRAAEWKEVNGTKIRSRRRNIRGSTSEPGRPRSSNPGSNIQL